MASNRPSVAVVLRLLDELSSAQKTLHALNEDLLRATVDGREDVQTLRELVAAQHSLVQGITDRLIEALRASRRGT